jgi:hypothetical protein
MVFTRNRSRGCEGGAACISATREESASGRTPAGQVLDGFSGPSSWIGKARELITGARSTARYKAKDGTGRRQEPRTLRMNLPRGRVRHAATLAPCDSVFAGFRLRDGFDNLTCAQQGCGPIHHRPTLPKRPCWHLPEPPGVPPPPGGSSLYTACINPPGVHHLRQDQANPVPSSFCTTWYD